MFIKMLDDKQSKTESKAYQLGIEPKQDQLTFKKGDWENSDTKVKIPYENLRWKNFKNLNPKDLSNSIKNYCYPFIKQLNKDSDDVFSNFLTDVTYAFDGKEDVLVKVVDILSTLDFTDNDVIIEFRNSVVHNKILLNHLYNGKTLDEVLKIFVKILPKSYRSGYIKDMNSCSKGITDVSWHIEIKE